MKQRELDILAQRADYEWQHGNLRSAFRLFLSCAKRGDLGCQLNLGTFYCDGMGVKRNRERALYWYRRAYRRGYGPAASNVGVLYRDEQNTKQALAWFERAVRLGDADANLEIAKIYVSENVPGKATYHLRQAINARPQDITEHSREQARKLLHTLQEAERKPAKRRESRGS